MIDLGSISIGHTEAAVDARNKIKNVVHLLTNDSIAATRLATATSEMCRSLLHGASPSHVAVAIDTDRGEPRLTLLFKGTKPISKTPNLEQFFDQVATNSPTDVSVVKLLPHSKPPDERLIAHLRAIIERKSHEELMEEIQTKNQELEQHRAHLEETVKERTAQLEEALETIQEQKERMEGELNIGREIQMSMIPLVSSLPNFDEISLAATLRPAREVGGDFYDFFLVGDNRFCFCVGDVSGKGVPAALFMAMQIQSGGRPLHGEHHDPRQRGAEQRQSEQHVRHGLRRDTGYGHGRAHLYQCRPQSTASETPRRFLRESRRASWPHHRRHAGHDLRREDHPAATR
jgi:sigma-B regulation protein RsbU (phosphoserine phosphatase)